jgi:hypothetical protein
MNPKLHPDDGLDNFPFAMDDALEQKGLDSLCPSPVGPKKARFMDLGAREDRRYGDCVQEVLLGRDILEVKLKSLTFEPGKEIISLVNSGLKGMSQTEPRL